MDTTFDNDVDALGNGLLWFMKEDTVLSVFTYSTNYARYYGMMGWHKWYGPNIRVLGDVLKGAASHPALLTFAICGVPEICVARAGHARAEVYFAYKPLEIKEFGENIKNALQRSWRIFQKVYNIMFAGTIPELRFESGEFSDGTPKYMLGGELCKFPFCRPLPPKLAQDVMECPMY